MDQWQVEQSRVEAWNPLLIVNCRKSTRYVMSRHGMSMSGMSCHVTFGGCGVCGACVTCVYIDT